MRSNEVAMPCESILHRRLAGAAIWCGSCHLQATVCSIPRHEPLTPFAPWQGRSPCFNTTLPVWQRSMCSISLSCTLRGLPHGPAGTAAFGYRFHCAAVSPPISSSSCVSCISLQVLFLPNFLQTLPRSHNLVAITSKLCDLDTRT